MQVIKKPDEGRPASYVGGEKGDRLSCLSCFGKRSLSSTEHVPRASRSSTTRDRLMSRPARLQVNAQQHGGWIRIRCRCSSPSPERSAIVSLFRIPVASVKIRILNSNEIRRGYVTSMDVAQFDHMPLYTRFSREEPNIRTIRATREIHDRSTATVRLLQVSQVPISLLFTGGQHR